MKSESVSFPLILNLEVNPFVVMTQGEFKIIDEIDDSQEQAELARRWDSREDLDEGAVQTITGLTCLAVPIRSLADLRDCKVNSSYRGDLHASRWNWLSRFRARAIDAALRAHARFFAPADNIAEDPDGQCVRSTRRVPCLSRWLVHRTGQRTR
jgi:predicted PhzF superfamily epimerase YddE/YHI9